MDLKNTYFGDISYKDEDILEIAGGLVGFPNLTRFLILDFEAATPFKWLQSVEEPNMGFLIAEPRLFRPEFSITLDEKDLAAFEAERVDDLVIFVICTYREQLEKATGNLMAPIVANEHTRMAQQIILEGMEYTTHESIRSLSKEKRVTGEKLVDEGNCG